MSGYTNTNDDDFVALPDDMMQPVSLATEPEVNLKVKGKRERMYRLLGLLCIVVVVLFFIVAISRGEGKKKVDVCTHTRAKRCCVRVYVALSSLYTDMFMQRKRTERETTTEEAAG